MGDEVLADEADRLQDVLGLWDQLFDFRLQLGRIDDGRFPGAPAGAIGGDAGAYERERTRQQDEETKS